MSQAHTPSDDPPAEIDFSGGTRGKFFHAGATLNLPVYLGAEVPARVTRSAAGVGCSTLVNAMLRKDIELIEIAKVVLSKHRTLMSLTHTE